MQTVWLLMCALGLAGCSINGKQPLTAWGKQGVSMLDYRTDSGQCALIAVTFEQNPTDANSAGGISIGSNGVISECTSKSNTGNGISANQSVAILNCTVSANTIHGIQISDDCVVRGNACDSNGSAVANGSGIYVPSTSFPLTNSDNRIEGNNCSDNAYGIQVLYSGNVIIRNTCTGNATANFNISASNTKGTIVVATGVDITTSNSYANFEY